MSEQSRGLSVADLESRVANQIASMMEKDGLEWSTPWARMRPFFNCRTNATYRGSNVFSLMIETLVRELDDPRFLTFKQARFIGGSIKKGSKGIPLIRYGTYHRKDQNGVEQEFTSRFAKVFYVFPISCLEHESSLETLEAEGIITPATYGNKEGNPDTIAAEAEAFFSNCAANVKHGGDRATYAPRIDTIHMPNFEDFVSAERYYGVLAHEHIHWTGAEKRLDREMFKPGFDYAFEELIAEIGSVMLCMSLGIQAEPRPDNASYVKGWINRIRDEPHALFAAASAATKASQYCWSLQPETEEKDAA